MSCEVKDVLPRRVLYHQTHHVQDQHISLLPLLTYDSGLTHLILAAIHLEECLPPHHIHLNNEPPDDPKFDRLWDEIRILQTHKIKVMLMLGGAARGSYALLDGTEEQFEKSYRPLHDLLLRRSLQGVDLDVEEHISLGGIIRLIDRLRNDFGFEWIISLAPVATAMHGGRNLSGFDYKELETARGADINFYNTQFYCNHGTLINTASYEKIMHNGWDLRKIVIGMVTNHANGAGWIPVTVFKRTLRGIRKLLKQQIPRPIGNQFGGIMGWEYYNSLPGGLEKPYQWICLMSRILGSNTAAERLD